MPDYEGIEYGTGEPFSVWLFDHAYADFHVQNNLSYPVLLISPEGCGSAESHAYRYESKVSKRGSEALEHLNC